MRVVFALVLWLCTGVSGLVAGGVEISVGFRPVSPYVVEGLQGQVFGLEYEIVTAAFAAKGYKVKPVLLPFARLVETFAAGNLDAAAPMQAGFQAGGFLSEAYIEYHNVAVALASRKIDIAKVEDLANYSLAAFQRAPLTLGERYAVMAASHPRYQELAQQSVTVKQLFAGRVDVIIGERRILRALIRDPATGVDPRIAIREFAIFAPNRYRVAARNESVARDFDAGLALIKANGSYAAIVAKYRDFE